MRTVDLIVRKRDGGRLSRTELAFIVHGAVDGSIPDYQLSAWLMAVCLRGMEPDEAADLALEMAGSGSTLDLQRLDGRIVADKHSTGGVGDKTTIVVVPIVAACGVPVAKLSGRGLGHTGGTIDKLESIRGFRTELDSAEFRRLLVRHGAAIAGQSSELAPADGVLYALRDTSGSVASLPLIAASIMSKKLAAGAGAILLDVKTGSGAVLPGREEAVRLAQLMQAIGRRAGRRVEAVLSNMEQPLGYAIGNALELAEAIACLKGNGPPDLDILCRHEAALLLQLAEAATSPAEAEALVDSAIAGGRALAKLAEIVAAQGGDAGQVLDARLLPTAEVIRELPSPRDGFVAAVDARIIGVASVRLGAGRAEKGDRIRHEAGFVLRRKIGDPVRAGEPLLEVHAADRASARAALAEAATAYRFSDEQPAVPPLLMDDALQGGMQP